MAELESVYQCDCEKLKKENELLKWKANEHERCATNYHSQVNTYKEITKALERTIDKMKCCGNCEYEGSDPTAECYAWDKCSYLSYWKLKEE